MYTVVHLTSRDDDWGARAEICRPAGATRDAGSRRHDASRSPRGRLDRHAGLTRRDDVRDLIERGVTVTAGATCFDARDLPREAIDGVTIVPSGVSELVRLQSEGYNYVNPLIAIARHQEPTTPPVVSRCVQSIRSGRTVLGAPWDR